MRGRLLAHQLVTDGHERLGRPRRARDQPAAEEESDDGDHTMQAPRDHGPQDYLRGPRLSNAVPALATAGLFRLASRRSHAMDLPIPPVESQPRPEDVRFLPDQLYLYNVEKTGFDDGQWLAFFVRDADGAIAAGLHGWTWGSVGKVQTLWVREDLRRRGYGTRLLAAAETEAKARGCMHLTLDTYGFQAPLFYQKHGYEVVDAIEDALPPHCLYRLKKTL